MNRNVRTLLAALLVFASGGYWLYQTAPAPTIRAAPSAPAPLPAVETPSTAAPVPAPAPASASKTVDFSTLPRLTRRFFVVEAIEADNLADVLAEWELRAEQSPVAAYQLAFALLYCVAPHDSVESVEQWARMTEAGYRKEGLKSDAEIAELTARVRNDEMRRHLYCRGIKSAQVNRLTHWRDRAAAGGVVAAQEWQMRDQRPKVQQIGTSGDWVVSGDETEYCERRRASLARGSVTNALEMASELRFGLCLHRDADLERMALNIAIGHTFRDSDRPSIYAATRHLGPAQQQAIYDQAAQLLQAWQDNGGAWDENVAILRGKPSSP